MNKFEAERRLAQRMKDNYPPGTRIMLLQMSDDPRPVEPNTRGAVAVVDDIGTLHCNFDNGRQLGIVSGEDSFRRLTDQELAEEKDSQKRQLTEMSEDELYERDILRFDSFDDFFDFIYDENTDKADIINDMSQQMKRQIVSENTVNGLLKQTARIITIPNASHRWRCRRVTKKITLPFSECEVQRKINRKRSDSLWQSDFLICLQGSAVSAQDWKRLAITNASVTVR